MIRLLSQLFALFGALYTLAMMLSFVFGLIRFLIAAPSAIKADMDERRRREAVPEPRDPRYVENEVAAPRTLPRARPELPPRP